MKKSIISIAALSLVINCLLSQTRITYYEAIIKLSDGNKIKGVIHNVEKDRIIIIPNFTKYAYRKKLEQKSFYFSPEQIHTIEFNEKGKLGKGAVVGAVIGFTLGGMIGVIGKNSIDIRYLGAFHEETKKLILPSAFLGGIFGAMIGAASSKKPEPSKFFLINQNLEIYSNRLQELKLYTLANYERQGNSH